LRGIERGPQKVVSLWVRIHGAALLKPEFTPTQPVLADPKSTHAIRRQALLAGDPAELFNQ
jgi:hypothetical protein